MANAEFIQKFVLANFGKEYHPVLHGRCETLAPLAVVVKRKTKWYKPSKLIVMAELRKYITKEQEQTYKDLVREKMRTIKKRLEKAEVEQIQDMADSSEIKFEVEDVGGVSYVTKDLPGDVVLGQLDEAYFEDPDLREILNNSTLDKEKIRPICQGEKIYIVTSVVYSEKFKIKGKPEYSDSIDAHLNTWRFSKIFLPNTSLRGSWTRFPSPRIARKGRGPLLFAYNKVTYNQETSTLKLNEQEFVGKTMLKPRGADLETKKKSKKFRVLEGEEYKMTLQQDILNISSLKDKMDVVQQFVLSTERPNRKQLLRTFLEYFKDILEKGIRSSGLTDQQTKEHTNLLEEFGFEFVKGQRLLKISNDTLDDIRDYGAILEYLDGLSEDQWNLFLDLCEN